MRIVIETTPLADQRYPTLGDWQWQGDDLTIRVTEEALTSDLSGAGFYYVFLIGLHELVEAVLCRNNLVSEEEVDVFDMTNVYLDEPGDHPSAPYHNEHVIAGIVERMLAQHLGVEWAEYSAAVDHLTDQDPRANPPAVPSAESD